MADTKYPTIRYQILDKCFRNKFKRYYIDDLIDACAKAIYDYCGKEIGLGSPPAKDIISGLSVTFKISLIKEDGVFLILSE